MQYTWFAVFCSSLVFAGCTFDAGGADQNGHDGSVVDASVADAPQRADAAPDARRPDASTLDAAIFDGGAVDAGAPDATAGAPDASMPLGCPSGYNHGMNQNSDHCYRFVATAKSWQAAEADCENDNTSGSNPVKPHLIVFSNEVEFNDVRAALGGQQMWVGADDIISEGNFVNVTGGPFITTHFRPGEPNDMGPAPFFLSEDCVLFVIDANPGFNDAVCTGAHNFLCELDGASPL